MGTVRLTGPSGSPSQVGAPAADAPLRRLRKYDLVCFSHLRWDSVFQRPQHLLTRSAKVQRVFFVEEPVLDEIPAPRLEVRSAPHGIWVAVPHLPRGLDEVAAARAQRQLVDELLTTQGIRSFVAWYYTPMALTFSRHLEPAAIVYDCMDELSGFRGAPAPLQRLEAELLARADVVFTGGHSLYEAKRTSHGNIYPFPSSIDVDHFKRARAPLADPFDQAGLSRPRLGYFGVIDERMDAQLLGGVAAARPEWQFVMVGPIVKVDPAELPHLPNIHYLGRKPYEELPDYLANWQVALMPFARNEATRFISPTKTPEYLAGAKPVISTSIRDVVRPYGELGLVQIASTVEEFVAAAERALTAPTERWLRDVDAFIAQTSWDETWREMMLHVVEALPAPAKGSILRAAAAAALNG